MHTKTSTKTFNFRGNSLRIGSAIVLIVGASLVIPKMADAALTLNHIVPQHSLPAANNSVREYEVNQDSSDGYEPPNFGRPLSVYGSGTR